MTLIQATNILNRFSNVIGRKYKGKIVSTLIIIPNIPNSIDNLIRGTLAIKNNTIGFENFNDFSVYGILEIDHYKLTGELQYESIDIILSDLDDEK